MSDPNGPYPSFALALACASVYDHLTTMDQEFEFIWRRPKFNFVQFLFLVTRYLGDAVTIHATFVAMNFNSQTTESCIRNMRIQAWCTCAILWAMQGLMIFRLAVIWRYKRLVCYVLGVAFALEVIVLSLIQGFAGRLDPTTHGIAIHRITCDPHYPADWYFLMWLPILAFEGVMLVIVIKRAMHMCPVRHPDIVQILHGERPTLMQVMMRDSILFPNIAVFVCAINFLGWLVLPVWFARVAVTITAFTSRILGCRLVLNLREIYYRPFEDEYMESAPLKPITFENDTYPHSLASPRKYTFSMT